MTITVRGVSNAAGQNAGVTTPAGTTSIAVTSPASLTNGDRVFIVQCGSNSGMVTPTSWNLLGSLNGVVGTGAVTASAGLRYMSVFWRDKDASWSTMPTLTLTSATQNSHWVGAVAITPTAGYTFDTPSVQGALNQAFNTATTSYTDSITAFSSSCYLAATCLNDNVTSTTATFSYSGFGTVGTATEHCDGGTATGNDVAGKIHSFIGTLSAPGIATNFNLTLSAASQGETMVIAQTESPPTGTMGATLQKATFSGNNFDKAENFHENCNSLSAWVDLGSDFSPSASGGKFHLPLSTTPGGSYIRSAASYSLVGSSLVFKVDAVPTSGTNTCFLTIGDPTYGPGFAFSGNDGYVYGPSGTAWSAGTNPYLRVSESGGTLTFDTSTNGSSWTNFSSVSTAGYVLTGPVYIYAQGASPSTGELTVDEINPAAGSTGGLAAAIPADTFSSTALQIYSGTMGISLQKALSAQSGSQVENLSGALAAALQKALFASVSTQSQSGSIAATEVAAAGSLSGVQSFSGSIAAALQKATASLAGVQPFVGSISAALQKSVASLAGAQAQSGSLVATLLKPVAALTGSQGQSGTLAAALQKAVANFSGTEISSGSVPWDPSKAAVPLTIWLKADAITGKVDGDTVSTWADVSGAGKDATNGVLNPPEYKTNQINGLPAVRFSSSGGTGLRALPDPVGSTHNYSMFAFGRMNGLGSDQRARLVGGIYMEYSNWLLGWWSAYQDVMYAGAFVGPAGGTSATTNWHSYNSYSGGSGTTFNDFGNFIASEPTVNGGLNGGLALSGYALTGTAEMSDGDVAEVIYYGDILSDDDRYRVEGYLAWKYGKQASLPGGHPYAAGPPMIGEGIAGVFKALSFAGSGNGAAMPSGTIVATAVAAVAALSGTTVENPTGSMAAAAKMAVASLSGAQTQAGTIVGTMAKSLASLVGNQPFTATIGATAQAAVASLAGSQVFTGTISAVAKVATASLTGAQTVTGTVAASLQRAVTALSGSQSQSGVIAGALQKVVATLTAAQEFTGIILSTLRQATMDALGDTPPPPGEIAIIAEPAVATVTGSYVELVRVGTVGAVAHPAVAGLTGIMDPAGIIAASLRLATMSAAGSQTQLGVMAAMIQAATILAAGVQQPAGTVSVALQKAVTNLLGAQAQSGTTAATIQKLLANLAGTQTLSGTSSVALQKAVANLAGAQSQLATLSASVQKELFSGSGYQMYTGVLGATLQPTVSGLTAGQFINALIATTLIPATFAGHEFVGIRAALRNVLFDGLAHTVAPHLPVPLERLAVATYEERFALMLAEERAALIVAEVRDVIAALDLRATHVEAEERSAGALDELRLSDVDDEDRDATTTR